MDGRHRLLVEGLLAEAEAAHEALLAALPAQIAASVPVDAQGVTRAIDHVAVEAGLSDDERRGLIQEHAVNPAVLHAKVFGATRLEPGTILGAFVDGARVRAAALVTLAETVGGAGLVADVQAALIAFPLPTEPEAPIAQLRAAYGAQERAVLLIADALDARS